MAPHDPFAEAPWERGLMEADPEALSALGAHPRLADLIAAHGPYRWELRPPFRALISSIVSQSVSSSSAAAVQQRLEGAVELTPAGVAVAEPETLRAAGLSWSKVDAIRRVAAFAGEGGFVGIAQLDDAGVAERLTTLKGVGPWTAEMFLLFCLGRPDVWPVGDLAIRQQVERRFGVHGRSAVREAGERFRPYRSAVTWYLWKASGGPAQG